MKHLLTTLLLATLCATGYGQTLKSVMIDTNGVQVNQFGNGAQTNLSLKVGGTNSGFFSSISGLNVVRGGNIIWTAGASQINFVVPFAFTGTNAATNAETSRANLGLGATWLTNTNVTNFRTAIGLGVTNAVQFASVTVNQDLELADGRRIYIDGEVTIDGIFTFASDIRFNNTTNAATTRTNLGLPLPALTNTSNVTIMRALAGSTNTNEPFSGFFTFSDGFDVFNVTVSNGIILSVSEP